MSAIFGEVHRFPQAEGPDLDLYVAGDEFSSVHETQDGYTVIYDRDLGLYCYATKTEAGALVSSGQPATGPVPEGTRRHLRKAAALRREERRRAVLSHLPPPSEWRLGDETFGAAQGLLPGRKCNLGKVRGLTVLVEFPDSPSRVTREQALALLNQPGYSENGNHGSVRDYFLTMSSGKLDYENDVVGPIRLRNRRAFYVSTLMVKEVLDAVVASGVDLRRYDSKGEKIVDAINILYAGRSVYEGELWPHNHYLEDVRYGEMRISFYLLTGMGASARDFTIGTICHENGHLLCRFPDMYDYGERDGDRKASAGIGHYCLMGAGNHLNGGRTPAPVCSYLRELAGWCPKVIRLAEGGEFTARHGAYDTVMVYPTEHKNEYFLVENRAQLGYDAHCPSSGLAIYHCDILGSNEWQDGHRKRHYQCALLQADGRMDLELDRNLGDREDLFGTVSGVAISHQTRPASNQWDGAESGLRISAISAPGETIRFQVANTIEIKDAPQG